MQSIISIEDHHYESINSKFVYYLLDVGICGRY